MKAIGLLIISIFGITISCFSQNEDSLSERNCLVSNIRMNAVYEGLDNPISVIVPGYSSEQIVVKASYGTLIGSNGSFLLKIPYLRNNPRVVTLNVFVTEGDSIYPSGIMQMRIKDFPIPTPYFGSKSSGTISMEEVKTIKEISVKSESAYGDLEYVVDKFNIVIVPKKGQAQLFQSNGSYFSGESLYQLVNLSTGDLIIATNIWAHLPNNYSRQLPGSIVLTVE